MIVVMLIIMVILASLVGLYTFWRIRKIFLFSNKDWNNKKYKIIAAGCSVAITILCINIWSTGAVIILHAIVISMLLDVASYIIKKFILG